jgi:nucleoside-diphosphate-sugar epimerase
MAKLLFGCGYLGGRVARLWRDAGHKVYVVTRSAAKGARLAQEGIRPLVADLTDAASLADCDWPSEIDTVLFSVGYDRGSALAIDAVYAQGLANVLAALPPRASRFIYISTTGVYGNAGGQWVDEQTPCRPERAGGKASLAAEQALKEHPLGARSIILRLAGIYGPGRIPRADQLVVGEPIDAPADGYLNLIHVEDAAAIVILAEERAPLPRTYVVSDGQPVIRGEYYGELARLLDAPPPQFITPQADSPAARRAAGDKRASNQRLIEELAPQLQFPSYREGLADAVRRPGANG